MAHSLTELDGANLANEPNKVINYINSKYKWYFIVNLKQHHEIDS